MHSRCYQPGCNDYWRYGGSGIRVCERWHTFENFLLDMGERPPGKTLGRLDHKKDYAPGNCEWQTYLEQAPHKTLEWKGVTKTRREWSDITGIPKHVIKSRLKCGWSVDETLTTPVSSKKFREVTYLGVTRPLIEWSELLGVRRSVLSERLRFGWPIDRAFTTPSGPYARKS